MASEFEIRFHEPERILEVRYPPKPTVDSYDRYEKAVREAISAIDGGWHCLVDQSSLSVMPPELPLRIAELNAWARTRGMQRTARVVKASPTAELQASRILKNIGAPTSPPSQAVVAHTRDEAWQMLVRP